MKFKSSDLPPITLSKIISIAFLLIIVGFGLGWYHCTEGEKIAVGGIAIPFSPSPGSLCCKLFGCSTQP
jgi:hypothetical protein